jgi:hypothetical protein
MSQTERAQQAPGEADQEPPGGREDIGTPADTDLVPPLGSKTMGDPLGSDDLVSGSVIAEDWGRVPAEDAEAEGTLTGGMTEHPE